MQISVQHTLNELSDHLTSLQKEQIPFATAKALTQTAWNARSFGQDGMDRDLEKVKAYTLNAFQVKGATKRSQRSAIQLKPNQAQYLGWVIEGGEKRGSNGKGIGVPYKRKRITPTAYRKMVARDDTFIAEIKGIVGLWKRLPHQRVKLLIAMEATVDYNPNTWRYYEDVARAVSTRFPVHWNKAMTTALKSAR